MAKLWSQLDLDQLDRLIREGKDNQEISKIMGRTVGSVEHQTRGCRPKKQKTNPDPVVIQRNIWDSIDERLASLKPYELPEKTDHDLPKNGETFVLHLTDFHAGKVVKDDTSGIIYDEKIFRTRIDEMMRRALKLLEERIKKGSLITDVVIISTGDLVDGEDIYATQSFSQEYGTPTQVMLCVDVVIKVIEAFLDRGLPVRFYGVRGNHGRTGKDTNPTSNWDLMVYNIVRYWYRDLEPRDKVKIIYATESEHIIFDIRGHKYLALHCAPEQGDTPAGRAKFNSWARKYNANAIVYGHYHHYGNSNVDNIRLFRGGSLVGVDDLCDMMAKYSEPMQLCWGVADERIQTFFYTLDLNVNKDK